MEEKKVKYIACVCPNPECKHKVKTVHPMRAGVFKVVCNKCGTPFSFKIDAPKPENKPEAPKSATSKPSAEKPKEKVQEPPKKKTRQLANGIERGVLIHKRGLFRSDKTYALRIGSNFIGRSDDYERSDISIDDETMSRRSVEIFVDFENEMFSYKLMVRKALNPVYRNGIRLQAGEGVYLNLGDTIVMGKTKFVFQKADK